MSNVPYEPQKQGHSPVFWILLGCTGMVVLVGGFIAIVLTVVIGSMRSSAPVKDSVARAKADPRVVALLGQPIEIGWLIAGSINTENRDGYAKLDVPISGPKGKAKLHVTGEKKRGRWYYSEMVVTPADGGPEINLLPPVPAESTDTAPPAE